MPKLLVIADDLSGALDAGAQFAKADVATYVATDLACDLNELFQRFDVVAVNTETRHCAPTQAAEIVRELSRRGRAAGVEYYYKKTDSTLRGNIGAELNAFRETIGDRRLAFVPASPQLGRTTVNGVQFVWGRPLHESAFASDPRSPMAESFIPAILQKQTQVRTTLLTRDQWQQANGASFEGEGIYVFDAESMDDLQNLAALLGGLKLLTAVAAPAAFASCFPESLGFRRIAAASRAPTGPMLVVIGSVNEVSLKQAAQTQGRVATFWLPAAALRGEESGEAELVNQVCERITRREPVLLQTARNAADVLSLSASAEYERVCRNVARVTRSIVQRVHVGTLTVFGGDTLLAIARECGWPGFLPRGEVLPGIMHAELEEGRWPKHILSKPGGFGAEDALLRILDRFR